MGLPVAFATAYLECRFYVGSTAIRYPAYAVESRQKAICSTGRWMDAVVLSDWLGADALLKEDRKRFGAFVLLDGQSEIVCESNCFNLRFSIADNT